MKKKQLCGPFKFEASMGFKLYTNPRNNSDGVSGTGTGTAVLVTGGQTVCLYSVADDAPRAGLGDLGIF